MTDKEFTNEEYETDYELKVQGLENVLGKMHNTVGHAIIPFEAGGAVDMYYFSNHIKGTGFATMELLKPDGTGPKPNEQGTYELVAFTKYDYDSSNDSQKPFNLIERKICSIFTSIGFFSQDVILNPKDTCEIPNDDGKNTYLIFDLYEPNNKNFMIGDRKHHLLLCIELFKSEMEFARQKGSDVLFSLLKKANYYPYSDLERESVA